MEKVKVQIAPQKLKLNIIHAIEVEHYKGNEVFSLLYDMRNNEEISKETFEIVGKWLIDKINEVEG